ncbi:MAG: ABC transporter ATP-binding protein [Defluviitaleaceae bacterium]|nr:ABC transporter ATP-binding protein [Defluviitaleaceae bacterium]
MNAIEAKNINKTFKSGNKSINVLKDINLEVEHGDFFALIGLNGAGKTTLIRILSNILLPDSGELLINGMTYSKNERIIKNKIGVFIGSEHSLYGRLTAMENLNFFASFYNISSKNNQKLLKERMFYLLKLLNLFERKDSLVETYSKGMKQKLLIAKALLHNPDIIILDEPSNGVDVVSNLEIKKFLIKVNAEENKTIILTTHNLTDAEDLCNKLCILQEGRVVENGIFKDVYKKYFNDTVISILLKNSISENKYKEIINLKNVDRVQYVKNNNGYLYEIVTKKDSSTINIGEFINMINMDDIISISEKKITLEYVISHLIEKV